MCGGDFAALEAMLHDELLYTHSSGLTGTRKDLRLKSAASIFALRER
jgi:hypothetical protein